MTTFGSKRLGRIVDRMAGGGDRGLAVRRRAVRRRARISAGVDQRLVALHVDDDRRRRQAAAALRPRRCGRCRSDDRRASCRPRCHALDGVRDARSSVATTTLRRAARARALGDPHDHRLAADVGERLAGQPGGGVARRDQDGETMCASDCGPRTARWLGAQRNALSGGRVHAIRTRRRRACAPRPRASPGCRRGSDRRAGGFARSAPALRLS